MFCKTSPQTSFFDVQKVLPNVLSKEDWCYLYRDQVYPFIDEEIFRELYPSETGRPNTPIKKAVCGQKSFLTETCDKNNKTQFITDTGVTSATTADVKDLPAIQERLEEGKMKPEEHYADAGFVNGQTIVDSHDKGIALEGPSSGRSQSF